MKKTIVLLLIVVLLALNVFFLIVNYRLKVILNNSIQDTATLKNTISLVDTLYGRKYVVDVDTVTGYAKIIGLRHSKAAQEDCIKKP